MEGDTPAVTVTCPTIPTDRTLAVSPTTEKAASTESFSAPVARKLVTLRRISRIRPVKNTKLPKLKYVAITVDGWEVVVNAKRDQRRFREGQLVVFFQIDSFVPENDGNFWEEMSTSAELFQERRGFRIRTLRIGESSLISQGRVFHLGEYPRVEEVVAELQKVHGDKDGLEVAMQRSFDDVLGVVKWDVTEEHKGAHYGPPPPMIPRTALNRIQDVTQQLWERHAATRVQITEKLDGCPISIYFVRNDSPFAKCLPALHDFAGKPDAERRQQQLCVFPHGRVGVCANRLEYVCASGQRFWAVVERLGIPGRLAREGRTAVVQGELVAPDRGGPGGFYAFSLWTEGGKHGGFDGEETQRAALRRMGVPLVPLLGYRAIGEFASSTGEMLAKADGRGFRGQLREGFVLKNVKENIWVKVISNAWLEGYEE
ncbi:hypothetical protein MCOR27_003358 [Pyricularia oryzae]|uniref:RNA ligase domain-containing protein n=1 Tax=Pyricularia grisea TaxID=148305 RepID=A0ABQ8NJI3_PYRGI|nr:hypothetical protein MCOR01_001717 [Pyricularia oryzae]KAI6298061.1 hypothetical protein MCOR33_005772 [Pyricularia grisea]KAH9429714.1 hypothetical protein MCOR02_009451 [Pyricularia oryzae]KAI6277361.1 hypothetical protein MCOR26_005176 [Pyricularia oryzae]KAI6283191.1 hypothetical protein MCOR27_003358 [Pyricularia oryzae]